MSEDLGPSLRQWTDARVALGRTGGSVPYRALLDFRLSHARARDAVHQAFDPGALASDLSPLGLPVRQIRSQARDLAVFLQRPDLGRRLESGSRATLEAERKTEGFDLAIILGDGLSATATRHHGPAVVKALLPLLPGWSLAPLVIASFSRVGLQDEIGAALGARAALILLGERPGLGAPDSLSAYLVHGPKPGNTDADRNCVSNIRPAGLSPEIAAGRIAWLLLEARRLGFSGVDLKDRSDELTNLDSSPPQPRLEG